MNPGGKTTSAPSLCSQQAGVAQPLDHAGQLVVVRALPHQVLVGEQDAEAAVDLVEVARALVDEQAPQPQRLGVAVLQLDDPLAGALLERVVGVELRAGGAVEAVEVADGQLVRRLGLADVEQVLDEHAERAAPVADVVLADHSLAGERQQAAQRVADDRRAQVADVHLLGDVGCGVVDDVRPLARRAGARRGGRRSRQRRAARRGSRRSNVRLMKPGPATSTALHAPASDAGVDHRLGQLARVAAEPLGQRQRPVALRVGPVARPHDRVDLARQAAR